MNAKKKYSKEFNLNPVSPVPYHS